MKEKTVYEKMEALASREVSGWLGRAEWFEANQSWLNRSADIALRVLSTLDALNISQKELAERIGVSPQQVSKIVKGSENLTLETITKLEAALGVPLIEVCQAAGESESEPEPGDEARRARSGKARQPGKKYKAAGDPLAVKEEERKS
jgi:transcriptional regulator with XRE-family HTH domain